jgi:hypothetical protein
MYIQYVLKKLVTLSTDMAVAFGFLYDDGDDDVS